jgi:hypothetical protein
MWVSFVRHQSRGSAWRLRSFAAAKATQYWKAKTRTALRTTDAWHAAMQAGRSMGRRGRHNGRNQRQSNGCSDANSAKGNATRRRLYQHLRFGKQMHARQLLQRELYD